jgi:uncharacterized protein (DUF4415 family)
MKNNSTNQVWIDEDDAPELDINFFENAIYKENEQQKPNPFRLKGRPKTDNPKQAINIRLSQEVLVHFKSTGKGWQSRIDLALLDLVSQHKSA